jgi:peptidoglycan/LPS O-acetylase OafA/YrhL
MKLFLKFFFISLLLFFLSMSLIFIFANELLTVFPGTKLEPSIMSEWRTRTIQPALYGTLAYFIFRYLTGKNPTSPVWPIFAIFSFFTAAQIFLFFDEEYKFGLAGILTFVCSIIVMLILRLAHNQLKNEIRIDTF